MSCRDLLFELRTEELPPRALPALSAALAESIVKGLAAAGIAHGEVRRFATPRRLAVLVRACAEHAPDRAVERRGPPLASAFDPQGVPTHVAFSFAKAWGVEVADLARLTTEKGSWLAYRGTERGAATRDALQKILAQAIAELPTPKRMRWGAHSAEFVRPVHSVVLLFGSEVVDAELLGLKAGRITVGHRFHAPRPLALRDAKSYERALEKAKVVADFERRRELIRAGVTALAAESGGRALIEAALLEEVTALVEWPVPIAGEFEARFLALPREVVIATVQGHQRYFPLEDAAGVLTNRFITVSNIESRNPDKVREGNERVVRPRLSDAAFFWDQDRGSSLEQHAARLGGVTFQAKLGSYADKSRRVAALALRIGAAIGAGPLVGRAAQLAKADLMTAMVGEFPELQGTMGRHYAAAEGEPSELAAALEEQYLPRFAGDALPRTRTGQALALADKLDTLAGIFAIDQKPSGTKDPYGLRRAALGVLRILLDARLDLPLAELVQFAAAQQPVSREATAGDVQAFIIDRLRGLLAERDGGSAAEVVEAVLAANPRSPVDAEERLRALKEFLQLPDSQALAAANKRIANILKKTRPAQTAAVDPKLFEAGAEARLFEELVAVEPEVRAAGAAARYGESLRLAARLRGAIDAFFDQVMVMDENAARRDNRLALLQRVQALFGGVADLSRLPG